MTFFRELSVEDTIETITGVQFCLLSPEEIRRRSVCEIRTHDVYSGNEPVQGGVLDARMGVLDNNRRCPTCGNKNTFCPGHFGHVDLAKPVFYVQFMEAVKRVMRCVCYRCSALLFEWNDKVTRKQVLKLAREKRFEFMYKHCNKSGKRDCPFCKARQPSLISRDIILKIVLDWKKENVSVTGAEDPAATASTAGGTGATTSASAAAGMAVVMDSPDAATATTSSTAAAAAAAGGSAGASASGSAAAPTTQIVMYPEDVERVLRRISDEDCEVLGFSATMNRPEWMICRAFPVPPPCVRPTVHNDIGQRREDDLTHKICDIVKLNNSLKQAIAANKSRKEIEGMGMLLQFHVATFADNQLPGVSPSQHRNGRPIKSVTERLKSKEGRIRGNLMGKRVDFSARSVITPDPNISIDELGMPLRIAMNLTMPEPVNPLNQVRLQSMVDNGPDVYPGAKFVHKVDGRTIRLHREMERGFVVLEVGDVVDRHMLNGDPVLFNRQPSLHKMSMMAHRVRVMPYDTLRLNTLVTTPYNADYDGDEMNCHVPQSMQTAMELQELAAVPLQILSPRLSAPIITIVQDVALGIYLLTRETTKLPLRLVQNLLSVVTEFDGRSQRAAGLLLDSAAAATGAAGSLVAGSDVASHVIPRGTYMSDKRVDVLNGRLVRGQLSKSIYSDGDNNLIQTTFKELGPDATRRLLDNTQRLVCEWLCSHGYSVGISDLMVPRAIRAQADAILADYRSKVDAILMGVHEGSFNNDTIGSNQDFFEDNIKAALARASDEVSKLLPRSADNRLASMIQAKSKGKDINMQQMMMILGQQSVEDDKSREKGRVGYGFEGRTLPHFTKYDDSPEARGFVQHSYLQGLTPQEFFFHAIAGREGLIDTAVKTADSGYQFRKLVKAMEDCKVNHDMTVRNVNGVVVQYAYGGDGFDSAKLERQSYPVLGMSLGEIRAEYGLATSDLPVLRACMSPDAFAACGGTPELEAALVARFDQYWEQVLVDRRTFVEFVSGHKRYITKEMEYGVYFPINFRRVILYADKKFRCSAEGVSDLDPAEALSMVDAMVTELTPGKHQDNNAMLGILARAYLNPKTLVCRHRLTRAALAYLLDKIRLAYHSSLAPPAELVGIVAAQSTSEGSTQLTLNSVVHETKLLLKINGHLQEVTIGEFVDARVDAALIAEQETGAKGLLEEHPNDTWLAYIKDADVQILSCDEAGKISWRRVEAVTKHPVVNRDGSDTLLKVVTRTGREVIATKAKSFLKRIDNKVLPVDGDDLRVGDRLPVSRVLPLDDMEITHFDLSRYLPKTEFLYTSEVAKALEYAGQWRWWKLHHGKDFILPYEYVSSFNTTFIHGKRQQVYEPGCVYPKYAICSPGRIPELIPLDEDFGFFVGAYLAEGHAPQQGVSIANIDFDYINRVEDFCKLYNINYKILTRRMNNGTSTSMTLNSIVLGTLMREQFGKLAQYKCMPVELLAAPKPFLRELINAYFSGDGCVRKTSVTAWSTSRQLLESIQQVLARFSITASVFPEKRKHYKDKQQRGYEMRLSFGDSKLFAKEFKLVIKYKQEQLDSILARTTVREYYNLAYYVPDVVLSNCSRTLLYRDKVPELLAQTSNATDRAVLEGVLAEEVLWDEIKTIEEVRSPHKYVYDLMVEGTRNFNHFNGLALRDSFHSTGQQLATKAMQGMPRLKELLSASKNMKTPQMHIHLGRSIAQDAAAATQVLNEVCATHLRDIVAESAIFYDPSDASTDIDDDRRFVDAWHEFNRTTGCVDQIASPWLLRFTFDKEKMLARGLTMLDVYFAITTSTVDNVACVFSDDNAGKLVMRVRMEESKARDVMYDVKLLEQQLLNDLMLKGITGIRKAVKTQIACSDQAFDGDTTAFTSWKEFVLVTDGSNLRDVLGHPLVDKRQTTTNDVQDVYSVLGVEAARAAIMSEIKLCMADLMVQDRHLELLVDVMTMRGTLMSIERHGVNKGDIGPLAKCSFEESDKNLINAGIFAEMDRVAGVSANIMLGQIPCAGTGDSKILVDSERLTRDFVEGGPGMGVELPATAGCREMLEGSVFDFKPQGGYIADELSGRTLVAESGFLQRGADNRLTRVAGADLAVGSYLAVPRFLDVPQCATAISLHSFLNKKQFLFADDASKAAACTTRWDRGSQSLPFTVPFDTSDSFRTAYSTKLSGSIRPGHVYADPGCISAHFPDHLEYTPDMGRVMGSYLARGVVQQYEVLIPRMNGAHTESVKAVCAALNIGWRGDGGHLHLLNDVLPFALSGMLGSGAVRRIPDAFIVSPRDFLAGFLDGYCSFAACAGPGGALTIGCVNSEVASSLQRLLTRFAIPSSVQTDSHALLVRSAADFLRSIPLMRADLSQTILSIAADQEQQAQTQAQSSFAAGGTAPTPFTAADVIPNVQTKSYGLLKTVKRSALNLMIKTAVSPDRELFEALHPTNDAMTTDQPSSAPRPAPASASPDFLEQDDPIRGQSYVCLSFLCPEQFLASKDAYVASEFVKRTGEDVRVMLDNLQSTLCDGSLGPEAAREVINSVREAHEFLWRPEELQQTFRCFRNMNGPQLDDAFLKQNNNLCSMRGVKVRGVYSTLEEAQHRAAALQRRDPKHNIWVGEVGMWLPFSDNPDDVRGNAEYAESTLNSLMKEYYKNYRDREAFFNERRQTALDQAASKPGTKPASASGDVVPSAVSEALLQKAHESAIGPVSQGVDQW
ncbi:hypothetical protein HXX76_014052 [Chlamydomonas incerta]|uniref:DNA-directed RNA polymerase subunit n=1 Tax=Chlamydomonas incerta TaxID=51695 RepID=A0A835SMB6_CHLIN|nr:hypothetical protein HXX76_014052 [Chlamydomonas incerta]|eukprot:KAG2424894.1 hypothetical protein HXX76_014052 [Chlamydomonas incerta]